MILRRGRLRSTIKWGGALVTLLLLIVWVGSARMLIGFRTPDYSVYLYGGQLSKCTYLGGSKFSGQQTVEWVWEYAPFGFNLWFSDLKINGKPGGPVTISSTPLWFIALLTATPTLLIWRRDRKLTLIGKCPKCRYDRTGLPADRACPECGAAN